jgi:hypothetical protein
MSHAVAARILVAMSMKKVLIGFVPWAVFSVVATRAGAGAGGAAALLAFLIALGLIIRSVSRGESAKMIEVTGAVVFAAMTVASWVYPAEDSFLAVYGRGLAALILAMVMFQTLPVLPFTAQYARETVPREYVTWAIEDGRGFARRLADGLLLVGHPPSPLWGHFR